MTNKEAREEFIMSDIMNKGNKVVSFVKLALGYIDSGNFFRAPVKGFYVLLAVLSVLAPFYLLYLFFTEVEVTVWKALVLLLCGVVVVAGGAVTALMWWYRKDQLATMVAEEDDFPVTPIMTHLMRTAGEASGFFVGIVLFLCALVLWVLGGDLLRGVLPGFKGFVSLFLLPVIGFLIVLVTRFNAETLYALAATASNTKRIAVKTSTKDEEKPRL